MGHPNEALLRDLYTRFGQGDMAGVLALCDDGITFTVPGASAVAGTYDKQTFVSGLITKVMTISGGTFREEIVGLAASETHGFALLNHTFTAGGAPRAYRTIHAWEIKDGRLTRWQEFPDDLHAFEAAWGP